MVKPRLVKVRALFVFFTKCFLRKEDASFLRHPRFVSAVMLYRG